MAKSPKQPEIIMMPIGQIKPYWRNPRFNFDTIAPLVKSIERYGFQVPLVVDKQNVIVTGHARYKALQQMGVEQVPVIVSTASTIKNREYRILDNKIQEITKWDEEALQQELKGILENQGFMDHFGSTLDLMMDTSGILGVEHENPINPKSKKSSKAGEDGNEYSEEEVVEHECCPYCDAVLTTANIVTQE